jgi:hypothetical protein
MMTAQQARGQIPVISPPVPTSQSAAARPEALFAEAHRRRRRRRLAGAVAFLVLAGLVAGGLAAAWPASGAQTALVGPGSGAAAGELPAGMMPRFYVTLDTSYPQNTTAAIVRSSASGAVLATVHVPGNMNSHITAAGDDRTFVISETGAAKIATVTLPPSRRYPSGAVIARGSWQQLTRFYLLRIAANGRSASLTRLTVSVPANLRVDDVALSPDGGRIAMGVESCTAGSPARRAMSCQYSGIRVVSLRTGAATTWTSRLGPGDGWQLSWDGNDHIMFLWREGYRLLSLSGPDRNLLAARAIAGPRPVNYYVPLELAAPGGGAVITSTFSNVPDGNGRVTVIAKIIELSASTGRLLRVLYTATAHNVSTGNGDAGTLDDGCTVLALGPSGVHVLAECFGLGRLDGTRFTPLPGVPAPGLIGLTVTSSDFSGTADW